MNGIKHGILCKNLVLSNENEIDFKNLQLEFYHALSLNSAIEEMIVDRIISNYWRLKRIIDIEKSLIILKNEPNGLLSIN